MVDRFFPLERGFYPEQLPDGSDLQKGDFLFPLILTTKDDVGF